MAIGGGFVAGSIISKLIMDTTKWDQSVRGVVSKTAQLGAKLGQFGQTLSKKVTLPLVLAGAAAVKASADFEQKLVNAFSVTGSSSEAVKQQMSDLAREMGATTVFAATEAADAMYYMASAGWKADDMAAALKDTLDLAAATQTDLAMATEAVISTINQFGLVSADAGRVSNVFAAAISNSQATMDRLKTSMRYVGPVMNSLGVSVEETSSILMGLYNAGIDASTAGTALRMGLTKLMVPTKQSSIALANLGLTFEDVNPETHKLADVIQLLGDRGATTKDILMLFGQRAGPAFAALIAKGGDALKDYEAQITGTNRASEMAEMQIDTFKGSFKLLTSALTESAIAVGDMLAPAIRKIGEGITGLITSFNELGPQTRSFIVTIGGIVAALGPLTIILGKVLILVGKMQVAFAASKAGFLISAAGVGILVAALAVLVIGIMKVKAAQDEMHKAQQRAIDQEAELSKKLGEMRLAMKMQGAEFHELLKKYDYYPGALAMAIKKGKEGVEMQKALAKVSAKHREEIEKQKGAIDAGIPSIANLNAEFAQLKITEDEAKKAAEEWTAFMKSIGITTVEAKADRVKALESNLEKLHQLYKSGAIDMQSYATGVKKVTKEIEELSTTLTTTAIPAARFTASEITDIYSNAVGEMEDRTGDFTTKVKEETDNVIDIGKAFSDTFAASFNDSLVGMMDGTMTFKDAVGNVLGAMKSTAIQIFADIATGYVTGLVSKVILKTGEMAGSITTSLGSIGTAVSGIGAGLAGLITSLATAIATAATTLAAAAPAIIIVAALALAIFAGFKILSSIFGKKTPPVEQSQLHELRLIKEQLAFNLPPLFHEIIGHLGLIQEFTGVRIPAKQMKTNQILRKTQDYVKQISEHTKTMANKLKNITSAQSGGIFKQTELAIMHGTSSDPEIAAPTSMFQKFVASRGKAVQIEMQNDLNINIDVKDQIDPHVAQRITRETIIPQITSALETNDRQFRTKLEEVLKLRI